MKKKIVKTKKTTAKKTSKPTTSRFILAGEAPVPLKKSPSEVYLDRVRDAIQLADTDQMSREEYIGAITEIRSDLDGMIEAAVDEAREANGEDDGGSLVDPDDE